jgi:hypothetical protein
MFDIIPKNIIKEQEMLLEPRKKRIRDLTPTSFRIESDIVKEFRILCKKHNISMVGVVRNAMKQVIKELKER